MDLAKTDVPAPQLEAVPCNDCSARYLYCVAETGEGARLGPIGIEGREVYVVAHRGLGAVVHDGPPRAYQTKDRELAAAWVLAHHHVVETVWQRWGTVLPLTFNTIVSPGDAGPDQALVGWLATEHDALTNKLQTLIGKAEYGVQVSCDSAYLVTQAEAASPEVGRLEEAAKSASPGLAYMFRQKLEAMLKREVESQAVRESGQIYERLRACADVTRIERPKAASEGQVMLLNLSCLVSPQRFPGLEAEVGRLRAAVGLSVHLAGPFPPYSFC